MGVLDSAGCPVVVVGRQRGQPVVTPGQARYWIFLPDGGAAGPLPRRPGRPWVLYSTAGTVLAIPAALALGHVLGVWAGLLIGMGCAAVSWLVSLHWARREERRGLLRQALGWGRGRGQGQGGRTSHLNHV